MKMLQITLLSTLIFLSALQAFVEKSQRHQNLEIIHDFSPGSQIIANMRVENTTGIPRVVYSPNYRVAKADPESMAREYLSQHAELLHHYSPDIQLTYVTTVETPAGYRVLFVEEYAGIPVYKGSIKVSLNRQQEVVFVTNGYQPLGKFDTDVKVSESEALDIAENYLGVEEPYTYQKIETTIFKKNLMEAVVAQKVEIIPRDKLIGDWEILIDASTGTILRVEDKANYQHATRDMGPGWVYDPDPITAAGTIYGEGQFTDNGDQNSDSLNNYLKEVVFDSLDAIDGTYYLSSPYAAIDDSESPYTGLYGQNTTNFRYSRDQPEFEAVNIYFHLNKAMTYLNDSLGFNVMPFQYEGGVRFDPHGLDGDQNAHYMHSGYLAFGSPANYVDAGEDQAIIWHELGHGIHDWITYGGLSQVDGLSEGLGDYWAQSYTRSLGLLTPEDPQYDYFGQWGLQPWGGPSLRVTNFPNHYPEGLGGEVHYDGQLWSSSLMSIYDNIGRRATDTDCWEGISMTDGNSSQVDAAFAFIQADLDTYDGANLDGIVPVFIARGYLPGPVTAIFDADITAGIDSVVTTFEDLSFAHPGPITSWEWDFENDGIIDATEPNPQHTFIGDGAYSVSLVVSNGSDSDTLLMPDFVSVNAGVVVYDGKSTGQNIHDYSGHFISEKLDQFSVDNRYTNTLPTSLIGFDAVFISLGNIGEMGTKGTFLTETQINAIRDYATAGGKLYIEGGSFWGAMQMYGYADYEDVWDLFSIDNTWFELNEQTLSQLQGQANSLGANISFDNTTQVNSWYIDHFSPNANGTVSYIEPTYGNVAIQGTGEFGQKTFYLSYSLADLVDEGSLNTRQELLLRVLEYFNIPLLAPNYYSSARTGHAPLIVDFIDISTANPGIEYWQWDFDSDGTVDSDAQYPTWTYAEPGTYSVTLTIGNGDRSASIVREADITVFDGESALNFSGDDNTVLVTNNPQLNMTDALSLEAWIYPTSWGIMNNNGGRIFDKAFIRLFLNNTETSEFADSSLGLILKHQDGTLSKVGTTPNSIQLNEWQHVAVTYDAATSEVHLFVDGVDRTLVNTAPSGPIMNHSIWELFLGNDRIQSAAFEGRLDEVRIWDIAVPTADLVAGMGDYLSGDEPGLVAYFKMNEAFGDSLYDNSGHGQRGIIENASWDWGTDFVLPVGVNEQGDLPIERLLLDNYPNPFNPTTTLHYELPHRTSVEIQIFDIQGRQMDKISLGQQESGRYDIIWNGLNQSGSQAASGLYFCRIQTEHEFQTIKMLMLK